MTQNQFIGSSCKISDNCIYQNGKLVYQDTESIDFEQFAKTVYKTKLEKYSKFYKMDNLSKLAYLACEIALKDSDFLSKYEGSRIGVVLGNSMATIDTDSKYWDTVKDQDNYFPSPGDFVYTLPNIMIGEICIKHKIYGENCCLITEGNVLEPVFNYVNLLIKSKECDACIAGFVEYNNEFYEASILLIEQE